MQKTFHSLLAAFVLLIALTPKPAEAFLKFRTNYFSSPVEGTILFNGEPVVGAEVKREITGAGNDPGDKHFDETTTDKNGQFSLPEVKNKTFILRPQIFSANPGTTQHINVFYKGGEYFIFSGTKRNFSKGSGEFVADNKISLICDLSNHECKNRKFGYHFVRCQIKGAPQ